MLYKFSEIGSHYVVTVVNVEFSKQELRCPWGILYVEYPQYSFITTILLSNGKSLLYQSVGYRAALLHLDILSAKPQAR